MSDELEHLKELVRLITRRKRVLEKQQAIGGLKVDPSILLEIENINAEIEGLQAQIAALEEAANKEAEPQPPAPTVRKERLTGGNPFGFVKPVLPERFIGHQQALEFCQENLIASRPADIAISGERRIGKTSLLTYLYHVCGQSDWGEHISLFVDISLISGALTPSGFWREACRRLQEALEIKIPDLDLADIVQSQAEHDRETFRDLHRKCVQHQPVPSIILLLDEFELLLDAYNEDVRDLLTSLKAASQDPDYKITLITATREPLAKLYREFSNDTGLEFRNTPYQLEPLHREEMDRVVQTTLGFSRAKVTMTPTDLDHIWQLSQWRAGGAHPFFVQMAASLIFDQRRKSAETLTFSELERRFEAQAAPYRKELPAETPDYEKALARLEENLPKDNNDLTIRFYEERRKFRKVIKLEPRHRAAAGWEARLEELDNLAKKLTGQTFDQLARG